MRTVLLYGNSLFISTIGASLQAYPELDIIRVNPPLADAPDAFGEVKPTAIIFDRSAAPPHFALTLCEAHPDALVMAVDANGKQMLVLSGHQARAVTTMDLLQLLTQSGK